VERLTGYNGITYYAAGNLLLRIEAIQDRADLRNNNRRRALVRAWLEALPAIVRVEGERASRRFIEFFTATIRNRNTRLAYARGKTVLRLVRPAG